MADAADLLARLPRIISLTAPLLALILLLPGCSALQFGYNSLPSLGYWWADGYVDFTDAQSLRVKQDLSDLQAWHRHQELPRVLELLKQAEALAAQPEVSASQVCALVPPVRERLDALRVRRAPPLLGLAGVLQARQLEHLRHKYADNEERYRKEWVDLSAAELLDKRVDQLSERLEKVYGRLQGPQKRTLREALKTSGYQPSLSLREHHRRHEDILLTLRQIQQSPASEAQSLWNGLSLRAFDSPDPAYRQQLQELIEEHCQIVAAVQRQTSAEQRATAVQRLRAWQADLQALIAQP